MKITQNVDPDLLYNILKEQVGENLYANFMMINVV